MNTQPFEFKIDGIQPLREIKWKYVQAMLDLCKRNKRHTARSLGISYAGLQLILSRVVSDSDTSLDP